MGSERGTMQSNLECFLDCTTPIVPSQFLSKTAMRNLNQLWHPWEKETIEYFTLSDLWKCYDEWSAYGAGTPIILNNDETVVQYYVPYLSAIQIFTSNSSLMNLRREEAEAGDSETPRDSFSDSFSDESESDKWRWDGGSSEDYTFEQENLWHLSDRLGYLYFQYFERSPPYGRVPLMDKINGLARRFPGLMSLKSVDLSPASWMAVSWYPIYHIPTGRTVKDLSACFLTYHTLSSSFQDVGNDEEEDIGIVERRKKKEVKGLELPPFGLATYKMLGGNLWFSGEKGKDQEKMMGLLSAADSWLKQLRVQHHDFNYFVGNRHG